MARPTPDEISEQENIASENIDGGGSQWPGMSYEQGVVAAIRWMNGDDDVPPMSEDG